MKEDLKENSTEDLKRKPSWARAIGYSILALTSVLGYNHLEKTLLKKTTEQETVVEQLGESSVGINSNQHLFTKENETNLPTTESVQGELQKDVAEAVVEETQEEKVLKETFKANDVSEQPLSTEENKEAQTEQGDDSQKEEVVTGESQVGSVESSDGLKKSELEPESENADSTKTESAEVENESAGEAPTSTNDKVDVEVDTETKNETHSVETGVSETEETVTGEVTSDDVKEQKSLDEINETLENQKRLDNFIEVLEGQEATETSTGVQENTESLPTNQPAHFDGSDGLPPVVDAAPPIVVEKVEPSESVEDKLPPVIDAQPAIIVKPEVKNYFKDPKEQEKKLKSEEVSKNETSEAQGETLPEAKKETSSESEQQVSGEAEKKEPETATKTNEVEEVLISSTASLVKEKGLRFISDNLKLATLLTEKSPLISVDNIAVLAALSNDGIKSQRIYYLSPNGQPYFGKVDEKVYDEKHYFSTEEITKIRQQESENFDKVVAEKGLSMTEEQIKELAPVHNAMYQGWIVNTISGRNNDSFIAYEGMIKKGEKLNGIFPELDLYLHLHSATGVSLNTEKSFEKTAHVFIALSEFKEDEFAELLFNFKKAVDEKPDTNIIIYPTSISEEGVMKAMEFMRLASMVGLNELPESYKLLFVKSDNLTDEEKARKEALAERFKAHYPSKEVGFRFLDGVTTNNRIYAKDMGFTTAVSFLRATDMSLSKEENQLLIANTKLEYDDLLKFLEQK